jgi:hypothetical protein
VAVLPDTKYRAALIASLYHLKLGEVIDRAVVCYANSLRIADKMDVEFPRTGLETPGLDKTGHRRPPRLSAFKQHSKWFTSLPAPEKDEKPEEPS